MKVFKVFNIEFDGIDKSGKNSIKKQIFAVAPNKYIPKARGIMSQIAYSKMFNRDYAYDVSQGYIDNTLFVYLKVDKDDWDVRCELTHEHENNKKRSDVEGKIKYKNSVEAFDYAYEQLNRMVTDKRHLMVFNTSDTTQINVIKAVVKRMEELNADDAVNAKQLELNLN